MLVTQDRLTGKRTEKRKYFKKFLEFYVLTSSLGCYPTLCFGRSLYGHKCDFPAPVLGGCLLVWCQVTRARSRVTLTTYSLITGVVGRSKTYYRVLFGTAPPLLGWEVNDKGVGPTGSRVRRPVVRPCSNLLARPSASIRN